MTTRSGPAGNLLRGGLLLLSALLTACGGGGDSGVTEPAAPMAQIALPSITRQPAAASGEVGTVASFSVEAAGTAPFAIQWQRNGVDIPGANSTTYQTSTLTASDSGTTYSVRVSNPAGSVVSAQAVLTVVPLATLAFGTLATGVRLLTPEEEAQIISSTASQVVFSSPISLPPGTVALGVTNIFKVVSSRTSGTQTVLTVAEPALEEMFTALRLRGSYDASPDTATPASANGPAASTEESRVRTLGTLATDRTFSYPFEISDGGFTLDSTLTAKLAASVDYDYQASAGGLLHASLDIRSDNSLDVQAAYSLGATANFEKQLGSVRIPIPVSLADSALRLVGVRVVSIYVPVYAGARARAEFALKAGANVAVNGTIHLGYDPASGPAASSTYTGSSTIGSRLPTTPAGTPSFATDTLATEIYVRSAPALAFLNKVALLGVDTSLSWNSTELLQVIPASPPFCVTSDSSLSVSANGFFKAVGVSKLTTNPVTVKLYEAPTTYFGSCLAPVIIQGNPGVQGQQPLGQDIPVTVTVGLDLTKTGGAPGLAPTGAVTLTAQGSHCTANLTAVSSTAATASCPIAPLTAGNAVPVQVAYGGDLHYAPAATTTTVSVAPSLYTLLGHRVVIESDSPSLGAAISQPLEVVVGSGVELSSGQQMYIGSAGHRLIGTTIDIGTNYINYVYTQAAQATAAAFNGEVFDFDATSPAITGCALSSESTVTPSQVTVTCSAHRVTLNGSGLHTTVGMRVNINLTLAAPADKR